MESTLEKSPANEVQQIRTASANGQKNKLCSALIGWLDFRTLGMWLDFGSCFTCQNGRHWVCLTCFYGFMLRSTWLMWVSNAMVLNRGVVVGFTTTNNPLVCLQTSKAEALTEFRKLNFKVPDDIFFAKTDGGRSGENQQFLVGGFKYFVFSPRNPGEMIQFDDHIFQVGWKPPTRFICRLKLPCYFFETGFRRWRYEAPDPIP